jgi:hypothetical protein
MVCLTSKEYQGSTFREIRNQLLSDRYEELPTYPITLKSFFGLFRNKLFDGCLRTLNEKSDLLPKSRRYQKLVHPLGIALLGKWLITEENPYTGYFKNGSKALVIVRSSVFLQTTRQGSPRGFALAVKLFPTMNPDQRVRTADLFTIDVLAGTYTKYYTDVALTNEPSLGFNRDVFRLFGVILVTFATFFRANINPFFRPLWPVAELGLRRDEPANAPQWIMVKADPDCGKVDRKDLRDELRVENYKHGRLIFNIWVAPKQLLSGGKKDWKRIGRIELTESVTSYSCDHCLAFTHPKLERIF